MAHQPIETVFSRAFQPNTGIFVTQKTIHGEQGYVIDSFPQSERNRNHFSSRGGARIKYLIMHYTAINFYGTVIEFTSGRPNGRVSAHYIITEEENNISGGQVIQVVEDTKKAWHAGSSTWGDDRNGNLNSVSLGIEFVNKGFKIDTTCDNKVKTWYSFDEQQIKKSGIISRNIIKKYGILPNHVLGHADIAPLRKQDPGILFPWEYLYNNYGVGAWLDKDELDREEIISKYHPKEPCPDEVNLSLLLKMLKIYGYDVPSKVFKNPDMNDPVVRAVVSAFKAHFTANQRPELYESPPSIEDMYWAWALNAKYCPDTEVKLV